MDLLGDFASGIMTPLYYGVTALLLAGHWVLALILPAGSGWTWVLAIVWLTIAIRVLMLPLSFQATKGKRAMLALQPRIKELQKEYGHDRERLTQEQMKLWKETGTNPFRSCLPLLLELSIFFALYRVIEMASRFGADGGARGVMSSADAESLRQAEFAGAKVGDTLMMFEPTRITDSWSTGILALVLIVGMCGTQFYTHWKLLHSEMPPGADEGPYAQQEKVLLYAMPAAFAVGGLAFPLGVLVHWLTWFVWTMAEHAYIVRNDPWPGPSGEMDP